MTLEMRLYRAEVHARLRDLRGAHSAVRLLDAHSYAASQSYGVAERKAGGAGVVYPSVRDPAGECAALFTPAALGRARAGAHYGYVWNGERINAVVKLQASGVTPHASG